MRETRDSRDDLDASRGTTGGPWLERGDTTDAAVLDGTGLRFGGEAESRYTGLPLLDDGVDIGGDDSCVANTAAVTDGLLVFGGCKGFGDRSTGAGLELAPEDSNIRFMDDMSSSEFESTELFVGLPGLLCSGDIL